MINKGLYAFGAGPNFLDTPVYGYPYCQGFSVLELWEDLEPTEGNFNWTSLDAHFALAAASGKKVNILLYASHKCPAWIYDGSGSGGAVTPFDWGFTDPNDNQTATVRSPLVWESVYQIYWANFLTALGARYSGHPNLGFVCVTGGTFKDLSTGTVIQEQSDWDNLVTAGYTEALHQAAWQFAIDSTIMAFPDDDKVLYLGVLRPGEPNNTHLIDFVTNYIVSNGYKEIGFGTVTLNDTFYLDPPTRYMVAKIQDAQTLGHTQHQQMIYSSFRNGNPAYGGATRFNDFETCLDIAMDDGATSIEVWHDDYVEPVSNDVNTTEAPILKCVNKSLRRTRI